MEKPTIYLVFSGSADLKYIPKEYNHLKRVFNELQFQGQCDFIDDAKVEFEEIEGVFRRYSDKIKIFHFAGHSTGDTLVGIDERSRINFSPFIEFLGEQKGLEFVFFNGCNTADQIETLKKSGIPKFIVCNESINDEAATYFSQKFYENLSLGNDLFTSFQKAKTRLSINRHKFPGLSTRGFELISNPKSQNFPWEFHTSGRRNRPWTLPSSLDLPLEFPIQGKNVISQNSVIFFTAILSIIFLGFLYRVNYFPENLVENEPIILVAPEEIDSTILPIVNPPSEKEEGASGDSGIVIDTIIPEPPPDPIVPKNMVKVEGVGMSFYLDQYEVSNAAYVQFLNAIKLPEESKSDSLFKWMNFTNSKIEKTENIFQVAPPYAKLPVTGVTWFGAKAYARYYGKRLPYESEWLLAAREGDLANQMKYSGSNSHDSAGNMGKSLKAVGTSGYNSLLLHDMSGNVEEWCLDIRWSSKEVEALTKGGSFGARHPEKQTLVSQKWADPASGASNRGFRCLKTRKTKAL